MIYIYKLFIYLGDVGTDLMEGKDVFDGNLRYRRSSCLLPEYFPCSNEPTDRAPQLICVPFVDFDHIWALIRGNKALIPGMC